MITRARLSLPLVLALVLALLLPALARPAAAPTGPGAPAIAPDFGLPPTAPAGTASGGPASRPAEPRPADCDPVSAVEFAWLPRWPHATRPITFTATASGTLPITYTWSFGDGTTGSGETVTHSYALAGDYTVTVTATNCATGTATVTHTLTVAPCEPVHAAGFAWEPLAPAPGQPVSFASWIDMGIWPAEQIDTDISVTGMALRLDAAGRPHVGYGQELSGGLHGAGYAYYDGTAWITTTIAQLTERSGVALDLGPAGTLHVSYVAGGVLTYARYDGAAWVTATVDGAGPSGENTALAVDAAGRPHIAYCKADPSWSPCVELRYASYDGAAWVTATVDSTSGAGRNPSLALDAAGRPHVSYQGPPGYSLKYAYHDGAAWHVETVDDGAGAGAYSSLALDTAGRPRIAYYGDYVVGVRYAAYDGATWQIEPIQSPMVAAGVALALDRFDLPRLAYADRYGYRLVYAHHDGLAWHWQSVTRDTYALSMYLALALDGSDAPRLAYANYNWDRLHYARMEYPAPLPPISYTWDLGDGSWAAGLTVTHSYAQPGTYKVVLTATNCLGDAITATRALAVVVPACDAVSQADFAWWPPTPTVGYPTVLTASSLATGTAWLSQTIDSVGWEANVSLELDQLDLPHVVYFHELTQTIRYAHYDGTAWHTATIAADIGYGTCLGHIPLALDGQDRPHIVYCNAISATLHYAWFDGSVWQNEVVDSGLHTWAVSLALDASGRPHLGYCTHDPPTLKHAWHDGSNWQYEVVDGADYWYWPVLALDAQDRPRMAYYTGVGGAEVLRYARYDGISWITATVDSGGCGGHEAGPSLRLDATGEGHVAYTCYRELRYAHHDGAAWITMTLDIGEYPGYDYPTLLLDGAGRPHIGYDDTDAPYGPFLKYAYFNGDFWTIRTVGEGGPYVSYDLDEDGFLHASYLDYPNPLLEYGWLEPALRPPTPPITYTWALGDGTLATGEVISHSYAATGTYTVVLTATNCWTAATAAVSHTLAVVAPQIAVSPVPTVTLAPREVASRTLTIANRGNAVLFWSLAETPPVPWLDEGLFYGLVDPGMSVPVTLTYTAPLPPAHYTTTLRLSTNDPFTPVVDVPIVLVVPAPCSAVQILTVTTAISGCQVTFGAVLTGTAPFSYTWDFGSFGVSTATKPLVDFVASGTYSGSLAVENCGGAGYATRSFAVTVACDLPAWAIYLPLLFR